MERMIRYELEAGKHVFFWKKDETIYILSISLTIKLGSCFLVYSMQSKKSSIYLKLKSQNTGTPFLPHIERIVPTCVD